jgi:hypothetical protein
MVAGRRALAGHQPGEEGGPDRWGPPIGGRERGQDTLSGSGVLLGWAEMEAGLERFPEAFFLFSVFFSFSFYRFLNYSNLLQFRFKSNQTRSCNILIIQAMF